MPSTPPGEILRRYWPQVLAAAERTVGGHAHGEAPLAEGDQEMGIRQGSTCGSRISVRTSILVRLDSWLIDPDIDEQEALQIRHDWEVVLHEVCHTITPHGRFGSEGFAIGDWAGDAGWTEGVVELASCRQLERFLATFVELAGLPPSASRVVGPPDSHAHPLMWTLVSQIVLWAAGHLETDPDVLICELAADGSGRYAMEMLIQRVQDRAGVDAGFLIPMTETLGEKAWERAEVVKHMPRSQWEAQLDIEVPRLREAVRNAISLHDRDFVKRSG